MKFVSGLEIVDARDQQVVTIIEVLSPANKLRGAAGREAYLAKQRDVQHSATHLVEIDLLRAGDRVQAGLSLPPHEYLVHVSRKQKRPRGMLWPIQLPQRLPRIPIPLMGQRTSSGISSRCSTPRTSVPDMICRLITTSRARLP